MLGTTSSTQQNTFFSSMGLSDMSVGGRYGHRTATERSTSTAIPNNWQSADFLAKPSLKDRLVYPLKAIRNRIYTATNTANAAGVFAGMGIGTAVGVTAGSTLALIPQFFDLLTFSVNPYVPAGALVGKEVGIRVGAVLGLGIGAAATLATTAIGLALSMVHLPRDIYHAATLDAPRLDAPLPKKPWLAEKLSQELDKLNAQNP